MLNNVKEVQMVSIKASKGKDYWVNLIMMKCLYDHYIPVLNITKGCLVYKNNTLQRCSQL